MRIYSILLPVFLLHVFIGHADENKLKPIFLKKGKVQIEADFEKSIALSRKYWIAKQHSRWSMDKGLLKGIPSTKEYQAKKKAEGNGHTGDTPRLGIANTPKGFILTYSFKLEGGTRTKLIPLVEFGHHFGRVHFADKGMKMLSDHEKKVLTSSDFTIELDKWYHIMIEYLKDEVLIQFQDGPTLHAKDSTLIVDPPVIGITGTKKGNIYIDNFNLYHADTQLKSWPATLKKISK